MSSETKTEQPIDEVLRKEYDNFLTGKSKKIDIRRRHNLSITQINKLFDILFAEKMRNLAQ